VSANPTSSLHVGHGRGAAYGMTVANLLEATGAVVDREYYVNDAGRQMDILATSTYLRYLELQGQTLVFPKMPTKATMSKKSRKALLKKMAMHMSALLQMSIKTCLKMCNMRLNQMLTAIKSSFQVTKKNISTV
jgi:arginyl-tRNA synthetase